MPYSVRKTDQCPASKPWGVFKKQGGALVSCHVSKEKANSAVAAIYANEGDKSHSHLEDQQMAKTAVKQVLRRMVVPFSIKAAADPASHTFEGLAAVIGVKDLGNDIIEPGAFLRTLAAWKASGDALPLLDSHNQYSIMGALGQLISAKESKDGLETKWEIIPGPEGDAVMTRLAPSAVTGRPIVGKMSIGYVPVKWEIEQPEGTTSWYDQIRHLTEIDLKECSLVLFPMAPGAAIDASTVKSFALSLQATDVKALETIDVMELRRLSTRIGNVLSKRQDFEASVIAGKGKDKSKKPVDDGGDGTPPAAKDDPEHPGNDDVGGTGEEDDDLDVVADLVKDMTDATCPDCGEGMMVDGTCDKCGYTMKDEEDKGKKPAKVPDASETSDVTKAQPYVMQEALTHRLQQTLLKSRLKAVSAKQE